MCLRIKLNTFIHNIENTKFPFFLFRQMGRRKSLFDSTVQTAIQQHVVEHAEHNKAQKKLWSSTAPGSDSRRLDLCLASGHSQLRKRE